MKVESRLQIRSKKIISYRRFTGYRLRSEEQRKAEKNLQVYNTQTGEQNTYTGKVTAGSRKRLIKAIELMVQTTAENRRWIANPSGGVMPFQLAFTTMTIHSPDRNILGKEVHKNVLAPFLQWLRRVHNINLYFWKAEFQQRGQIHYHLLLGDFVHYEDLQKKWNKLQAKHGYLDMYYKQHGHYNAPSCQIKNALEKKDVAGYLCKEICKDIQLHDKVRVIKKKNRTSDQVVYMESIGGKVWDCSMNLKEVSLYDVDTNVYRVTLNNLVASNKLYIGYETEECTIYKVSEKPENKDFNIMSMLTYYDKLLYKDHLSKILSYEPREKPTAPKKVKVKDIKYNVYTIKLKPKDTQRNMFSCINSNAWVDIPIDPGMFSSS